MFLIHFGVDYLPYLLLANPLLVLVTSAVYGAYADRIPDDRLMIYTALLPVPLIVLMRALMLGEVHWVYFVLYTFVLAYATILTTSWTVYLAGHYDVQEAKRLLPFIQSGTLIGMVLGGIGVALCAPLIGAANILWLWVGTLVAAVAMVRTYHQGAHGDRYQGAQNQTRCAQAQPAPEHRRGHCLLAFFRFVHDHGHLEHCDHDGPAGHRFRVQ